MVRRRVAPTPKKAEFANPTHRVKRSGATVDSDVPGHKNDSCGRAHALQESLALNQSRRFPAKRGRQTPLPFILIIATLVKVNPESLASRKDDLRNKLILEVLFNQLRRTDLYSEGAHRIFKGAPL